MAILIYGTINSVALALMALGFALVYGISRVPNFAHGALYVITGFIAWSLLRTLGLNYFFSIVLAIIAIGVVGALIYQFVLIRVRGMAISEIIASNPSVAFSQLNTISFSSYLISIVGPCFTFVKIIF